jgi:Peptidase family C25
MAGDAMVFNGIGATTGTYLLPPMAPQVVSQAARGQVLDPADLKELRWWHHRAAEASFGPKEGIDPRSLAQTGWGVIFAHDADPAVREALGELLDHRRAEAASVREHHYREFTGDRAYRPGESKQQFLARQGAGPGPADPDNVPYYLLLVGGPEAIPYSFQYQLDVQYAVGRLHFDTVEEYARYARTVVATETHDVIPARRAAFFAASNSGDPATALSSSELVIPLADQLRDERADWTVQAHVGEEATKERLTGLLGGADTPALLFTATHGIGFPNGHPRQARHQGALLCQDWPGPGTQQAVDERHYVSADDLGGTAGPVGMVSFHFACFGAGTPRWDDFVHDGSGRRTELAPHAFVAALPKRLLGHPGGGAIALVGHVERAWGYSFLWPQAGRQTAVYASCLERLFDGHPIGSAFEYFNERYAELSSDLSTALEDVEFGKQPDHLELAAMWTANNDARGFAILGDPAVRLVGATPRADQPRRPQARAVTAGRAAAPATEAATGRQADPSATAPPATASPEGAELDYALLDGVRRTRERLVAALQDLAENVGTALERAVDNLTVIEVATYVSDDLSTVTSNNASKGFGAGAELRALTRLSIDGDAQLVVPRDLGEADEALWRLHAGLLEQARAARAELLKTGASAVAGLLDALKVM